MSYNNNFNLRAKPWAPRYEDPNGANDNDGNNNNMRPAQRPYQQQYNNNAPSYFSVSGGNHSNNNNMNYNNNNHGNNHYNNNNNQNHNSPPRLSPNAAKLFVGQLPFECDETRLHHLFSAYGKVEHIHILRDAMNGNRSKGAAFVTYSGTEEADTAIFTLHNRYRMLTNRAIQVSYAKNSPAISPYGMFSAVEVHQSNPTNPLPDAAMQSTMF
ncbi:RNA recognition motif. (a.k.a. RRM, RBD, or RNP domain), putative [Angomonas deanei]|uniref:RNA recognition motif. (A.k.a. RRM, RBD, or RNP domain), putative n=1 Tax=Angomonas deanei TaxID=59799 RepID=A0A7G2C8L5_9TRYP|nr:RNA recognition motif. (a.k.a. RRM, RBD, or RNP domain), putative [Angomonas deanei]